MRRTGVSNGIALGLLVAGILIGLTGYFVATTSQTKTTTQTETTTMSLTEPTTITQPTTITESATTLTQTQTQTITQTTTITTITVIAGPSNIIIASAGLSWGNGNNEPCQVSDDQMSVTCPSSDYTGPTPTVYVEDSLMFQITFMNNGGSAGTLNSMRYTTSSGNNDTLALQNPEPYVPSTCTPSDGGPVCTYLSYPITIPPNGSPVNLVWTIEAVGVGSDSATFTFYTNG